MNEELQQILKYLRLWSLLANWDDLLARARRGKFSHERLLKLVLEEEYRSKNDNARILRRRRAHIPELLEIETYPFSRQPKLDRKRIMSLYDSLDFMTKQQNIIWLGPTGCGKTGLATSFLLRAIGCRVSWLLHRFRPTGRRTVCVDRRSLGSESDSQVRIVRLPGD